VEVICLTKGKLSQMQMSLQDVDLRKFCEDVLSMEEPKPISSPGELLAQGLRDEGWVPREQLYVCNDIAQMKSVWVDTNGKLRRYTLSHTLRLPCDSTNGLEESVLETINARIFAPPSKMTKHNYFFRVNGADQLDNFDSIDKIEVDNLEPRDRKEELLKMEREKQTACLAGRPDFAEILGVEVVEAQEPARPARLSPAAAKAMGPPIEKPRASFRASIKPKAESERPKMVKRFSTHILADVSEGASVRVGDGPHKDKSGVIIKIAMQGSIRRYRVQLDDSTQTTWTNSVKNAEAVGNSASKAAPVANVVSPLMAALTGKAPATAAGPGGKGAGGKGGKAAPPKVEKAKDEFPEGTEVEVLAGKEQGRCGEVIKILGEGKEKKYRVQMEAGGGAIWTPTVKKATRALKVEEVKTKITDLYDCDKKKIGAGAFGSCTKVVSKSTKLTRAMKTCPKPLVKNVNEIWKEVAVMKRLDHPNIIKIYDTFEDHRNIYLIMELCTGGELFDRIVELNSFDEKDSAIIMQQALRGVFYMHSKRIVHRDLKPENFLLTTKDDVDKTSLKIIDFGLAHDFPQDGEYLRTRTGSAYYVAPQVLEGKYTESADMWSFGVINFVLLSGYPPFEGETDPEIFAKVKTGQFEYKPEVWGSVSPDAKDLINQLLTFDQDKRLKAGDALKHTWIEQRAPKASTQRRGSLLANLRAFQSQNKLKKAALAVIANQMSESQIIQLKDTFVALDANGDGLLTVAELRDGIAKMGLSEVPADLQAIMDAVDANASGSIDYTEFVSASMDKKTYMQEDMCWAAFRIFDKNGDGKICKEELASILADENMKDMVAGDIAQILQQCDQDGDGEIDFEEFMAMMKG